MEAPNPILSVVIPTLGRDTLIPTLDSLVACSRFDELEILVCGRIPDGPVLHRLEERMLEFEQIVHHSVQFAVGDSSEKKNHGAREAQSEFVAFLDDDVTVCSDWVDRILAPFEDPQVGLVSGPGLVPPDAGRFAHLAGTALSSRAAGYVSERYLSKQVDPINIRWSQIIGCNMVYRKTVWSEVNGFPPRFWPGEEMIASWRVQELGYKLVFQPTAWVHHYPRASFKRFWRQIYGYGATRIRLNREGVEMEYATLVPGIWVLTLAASLFISGFSLHAGFKLLYMNICFYLLVDTLITLHKVIDTRRLGDAAIFFLVPIMHLSYGIAQWSELFNPDRDLSERPEDQ